VRTDSDVHRKLPLETVFSSLSESARVQAVAQRISAAVHLGLLGEGEQLPSEADLASKLSVSTVTVREALVHLRAQGLIETKRGRHGGSFVRRTGGTPRDVLDKRLRTYTAAEWRDLCDEQATVEAGVAYLAAQRATREDIDRLHAVLEMLPAARSPAERYKADSQFHLALAVVSQSERLARSAIRIQGETADVLWLPFPDDELDPAAIQSAHTGIVAAIEAEDGQLASQLARAHAQTGARRIRQLRLKAGAGRRRRGANEPS
jgi:GntR family transcriptional regulator, transcriptional repressor for pyruvate dehydrogenase complex